MTSGSTVYEAPLAFSASSAWSVETPQSRAIGTDAVGKTSFTENDALSISAAYSTTSTSDASTLTPNFMYHQQVTHDGSSWTYSPTRYWPTEGKLFFYAHYPYASDNISISDATATGAPTLTFTQPTTADIDLLAAETSADCSSRTSDKVPFNMKHVLAKVNFLFTNASSSTLSIKGASFSVPASGTFSHTYSNSLPVWTNLSSTNTTVKKELSSATEISTGTTKQAIPGLTSFILPCTLSSITLTMGDGTTKTYTPSIAIEAGKEYNLHFSAGSSDVEVFTDDANCYILNPPTSGEKTFEIPIKRIDTFWGNNGYENVEANTLGTTKEWKADILWSEYATEVAASDTATLTVANGTGNTSGFRVKVKAGISGNVVVAVRNAAGTILWSWHLWITDYDPNKKLAEGYTVMDRNLGALTEAYDDNGGIGRLFYQFGRKDPFTYKKSQTTPLGYATTDAVETTTSNGGTDMAYSIQHPTIFITKEKDTSYEKKEGWWTVGNKYNPSPADTLIWQDPTIHYGDNKKSLFDPSPAGWKIPEGYILSQNMKDPTWNSDNTMLKYTIGTDAYSSYVYFPAYGSISSSNGKYGNSTEGNYWSSWPTKDEESERKKANYQKARFLNLTKALSEINTTNDRARAMTIRCMYDTSSK